jgi:hypothetical protein
VQLSSNTGLVRAGMTQSPPLWDQNWSLKISRTFSSGLPNNNKYNYIGE